MTPSSRSFRDRLRRWTAGAAWLLAAAGGCGRSPAAPPARSARASQPRPVFTSLLPARVRRLTNVEYEQTVSAIVGVPEAIADKLPPDVRAEGYTPNAAQTVPSAFASRLDAIARDVAHRAIRDRFDLLVHCAPPLGPRCEATFVETLGQRAWRRPLEAAERALLLAAFDDAARSGGGFAAGAEAVLTALLESPSLLYLTELGSSAPPGAIVTLGPFEIASLLSYTLRGGPPDETLLAAATAGELRMPEAREREARRLLALSDTRLHFRRFILEWLEVDDLAGTAKDSATFPEYEDLKGRMLDETAAFVDEVMVFSGGSLRALLDARFASVDPKMARFYGLKTWGARASLAGTRRAGVLQQASFLAAHAHEDGTSPVKRGDFVLRKLLCKRLPRPGEVGIDTVFPPPSHAKTTRERFTAHTEDPACSGCHALIDPLGYAFEGFDAMGGARTTDNGKPIDTEGRVVLGDRTATFADSLALSEWLAESDDAGDCYFRQAFRYFTSQTDPQVEAELLGLARELSPSQRDNLFEALVAFIRSDLFILREVRP